MQIVDKEDLKALIIDSSLCHLCLSNISEGEKEVDELVETIVSFLKTKGKNKNEKTY